MAIISKGIKLKKGEVELTNLQEIPELGAEAESIEITTLADAAHIYTNGIMNYGMQRMLACCTAPQNPTPSIR